MEIFVVWQAHFLQKSRMSLISINIKILLQLLLFVRNKHNLIHLKPILKHKQKIGKQLAEKCDHEIRILS